MRLSAVIIIVCLLGLVLLGVAVARNAIGDSRADAPPPTPMAPPRPPAKPAVAPAPAPAETETAKRARLDATVWKQEVQAQEYEERFIKLWDAMRARLEDQQVILAEVPFTRLTLKPFGPPEQHRYVSQAKMAGDAFDLDPAGWRALIARLVEAGYRLEHSEWHHSVFETGQDGKPRSKVSLKLFVSNERTQERITVWGSIVVDWSDAVDAAGVHVPGSIDATGLGMTLRVGPTAFTDAYALDSASLGGPQETPIEPVLVYDLDGDGRDDIVLPNRNQALMNRGSPGHVAFEPRALCDQPLVQAEIGSAVLADIDGDGIADLVVAGAELPPMAFTGAAGGRFPSAPYAATTLPAPAFRLPMAMSAGDFDGDGHVDLWVGQYRPPFDGGPLPNPYWDANDGWPSFLLRNDGTGHFTDATPGSGLEAKRMRRNYSGSLVDLDGDGKADLITANDFSGIDVFINRGGGRFDDASETAIDQRHTYGMSHLIEDFDGDGRLDLFVAGMGSTTARRLEAMKASRPGFAEHEKMRMPMGYGNRLLLGTDGKGYRQATFNDQVARTGWSWGCAAIDVENAGWDDIYVANGFISGTSAKDYCTRWWTQDIYSASEPTRPDLLEKIVREKGYESWNGFEHKALLVNERGAAFVDGAYPMGLGQEWDGRCVIAADFDGDGRVDILTSELRHHGDGSAPGSVIHVFRNQLPTSNHWLAVRLREAPRHSAMDALITVVAGGRRRVAVLVTGDSYRAQHPLVKHFGLGDTAQVDAVEVRWADGTKRGIEHPPVDQELVIAP
jgi:hypothetical protein